MFRWEVHWISGLICVMLVFVCLFAFVRLCVCIHQFRCSYIYVHIYVYVYLYYTSKVFPKFYFSLMLTLITKVYTLHIIMIMMNMTMMIIMIIIIVLFCRCFLYLTLRFLVCSICLDSTRIISLDIAKAEFVLTWNQFIPNRHWWMHSRKLPLPP